MALDNRKGRISAVTPVRAVPPSKPPSGARSTYRPSPPTSPQRPAILRQITAPPPLPPLPDEVAVPAYEDPRPTHFGAASLPPPPAPRRRVQAREALPKPAPLRTVPPASVGAGPRDELPPPPRRPRDQPTEPAIPLPARRPRERVSEEIELDIDPDRDDLALELIARAEQIKPARVPRRVPDLSPDAASQMMNEARRAEEDGDHDRAFLLYRDAAQVPARASEALLAYGRLERSLGRRQQAATTFKDALHRTGDRRLSAEIYAELGQLYWAMREDEEAEYYYRRAARLDPSFAPLLESREKQAIQSDVLELDTRDLDLARIG